MPAYVYILRCRDESLYTGWTNDLEKRLEAQTVVKEQNIPVGAVL